LALLIENIAGAGSPVICTNVQNKTKNKKNLVAG
jgi:hypothetical protein